ncbi:MAG: AMIN domain-containing protein [Deltaproteobacteria bacterium]|nr:AMIN domain-containing protein [Deltaproteobacteria bacterium]
MHQRLSILQPTIFFTLCLLLVLNLGSALAENTPKTANNSYLIQDIKSNLQGDALSIEIIGNTLPDYNTFELFNPQRLILDIAHASLDKKINPAKIIPDNSYAKLVTKSLTDKDPSITRFEITINDGYTYSVDRDKNNLLILIHPKTDTAQTTTAPTTPKETVATATPAPKEAAPIILQDMTIKKGAEQSEVLIVADAPLKDFRHNIVVDKKGLPDMMYIDITGVDGSKLARETEVGTALSKIRVAPKGTGIRLLFDSGLPKLFDYTVTTDPKGLLVIIKEAKQEAQATAKSQNQIDGTLQSPVAKDAKVPKDAPKNATLENLIDSSTTAMNKGKAKAQSSTDKSVGSPENSFNFGGYKDAKRISVDFYKIDLHNVFRLFNDISGQNIIVDETVKGTLTLKLNDVPWDFALDIILNLKNLRKEERFNTIVIYPADKEFIWPVRAQDNLAVETDLNIVQQEQNALVIEQSAAQSEEVIQSKELIGKARIEEKADNMEKASTLYEQAFKLDPKNAKLANRLASLYLASLGINAKAVYFAKESLKIEPKNSQAALYAAIGLANMNQNAEATDYFAQSISDPTPMKEALISYASFSEQNGQPDAALKLLARYKTLYGESVETMVAKARIYDKMGQKDKADEQYRALLASGYQLAPGLKEYIQSRLTGGNTPQASKPL